MRLRQHHSFRVRQRSVRMPKTIKRHPAALVVITPVLLVTASFLGLFGLEDLSEALAFTGRFTGLLLMIAAVAAILGLIGALDHWFSRRFEYSGLVALIGTATAVVANVMLLVVTVKDGLDAVGYFVLWCALIAGSVWACYTVYRTSVSIPAPKTVGLAAIVSASVAIANFGYTQLYLPYQQEPRPILQAEFGTPTLSADRQNFALPVTFRFENRSNVGLYLLGSAFTVAGRRAIVEHADRPLAVQRTEAETGQQISQRTDNQSAEAVEMGRWEATFGEWVDPGVTDITTKIIELPVKTRYDQLLIRAQAQIARRDRIRLDPAFTDKQYLSWMHHQKQPDWTLGQDFIRYRGRIWENNSVAQRTRDPRYLTLWWFFNRTAGTQMATDIARTNELDRNVLSEETERMASRYGLVEITSNWETRSLWDVKHPQ